jgi:nucleoside-diphosphate-sugar epimerase
MLALGLKNDAAGMCVNLGSEDEISMSELAKRIARLIEQETGQIVSVEFSEGYPGDSKRRLPNLSEVENTLQWKAETSLEDGLLQTLRLML